MLEPKLARLSAQRAISEDLNEMLQKMYLSDTKNDIIYVLNILFRYIAR